MGSHSSHMYYRLFRADACLLTSYILPASIHAGGISGTLQVPSTLYGCGSSSRIVFMMGPLREGEHQESGGEWLHQVLCRES